VHDWALGMRRCCSRRCGTRWRRPSSMSRWMRWRWASPTTTTSSRSAAPGPDAPPPVCVSTAAAGTCMLRDECVDHSPCETQLAPLHKNPQSTRAVTRHSGADCAAGLRPPCSNPWTWARCCLRRSRGRTPTPPPRSRTCGSSGATAARTTRRTRTSARAATSWRGTWTSCGGSRAWSAPRYAKALFTPLLVDRQCRSPNVTPCSWRPGGLGLCHVCQSASCPARAEPCQLQWEESSRCGCCYLDCI
jgi:hypothetical protein